MNIKVGAAALTILAILTLASCASPETPGDTSTPSIEQTAVPDTGGLAPGDSVGAARAAELNAAGGDVRAYELRDGSFEVTEVGAPLSKSITADIESRLAGIPVAAGPEDSEAIENAIGDLAYDTKMQTGRNVVIVTKLWVGDPGNSQIPRGIERWIHIGDSQYETFARWDMLLGRGTAADYVTELKGSSVGSPEFDLFIHD